jgi:hypothetical protein
MGAFIIIVIGGFALGIISGIRNTKNPKPSNPDAQKVKDGAKLAAAVVGITAYSTIKELSKLGKE